MAKKSQKNMYGRAGRLGEFIKGKGLRMKKDDVYIGTTLDKETHEKLRRLSYETKASQTKIIREAVRNHVKESEGRTGKKKG